MVETGELIMQFVVGTLLIVGGAIFISVVAIVLFYFYRLMKYKVQVDIYESVNNTYIGYSDHAQEVMQKLEDGKRKTFLKLRKGLKGLKKIPLPDSTTFIPFGMRKKVNLLYKDGLFTPLPIVRNSDPALTYNPSDILRVLQSWDQDYSENLETHRQAGSFWDKWGVSINMWVLIIAQFIMFLILISVMKTPSGAGQVIL